MIIMYSTHCPKCKALEMKLERKNIQYEVCDDLALMQSKGFKSLPMLEVDGTIYNFQDAIKWAGEQA